MSDLDAASDRNPEDSGPISMIRSVAEQVAGEAGLVCTTDIQDLVIIAYLGLLVCRAPVLVDRDQLLEGARRQLTIWGWAQGTPTAIDCRWRGQ